MPIYEYFCRSCQKEFETLVLSSTEEVYCPSCGSFDLEKLFSRFGFRSYESTQASSYTTASDSKGAGCACSPLGCGCSARN